MFQIHLLNAILGKLSEMVCYERENHFSRKLRGNPWSKAKRGRTRVENKSQTKKTGETKKITSETNRGWRSSRWELAVLLKQMDLKENSLTARLRRTSVVARD